MIGILKTILKGRHGLGIQQEVLLPKDLLELEVQTFRARGARKAYMPAFNLSNITPPCYLYYDYAYARKSALSADELNVKISDDCGQTWINRLSKNTDALTTTLQTHILILSQQKPYGRNKEYL